MSREGFSGRRTKGRHKSASAVSASWWSRPRELTALAITGSTPHWRKERQAGDTTKGHRADTKIPLPSRHLYRILALHSFTASRRMKSDKLILVLLLTGVLFCACKPRSDTPGAETHKIRVGYIGLTCEAPIFTAVEKGFFKEEGLEVELVKCQWANYKDVLALGGFDITHHLVMYFLKPIEQGLDVKFTGGIHRGCLRVQAGLNSPIKTVGDLRGQRIGVPGMGTPPFIFANRVLGKNGIDASKDVTWLVFPSGELGLALDKGEVDAVADAEPIGSLLLADGKVRNVADQATDMPYKDEYCCAVIVNGKYLSAHPTEAAAATRALLK